MNFKETKFLNILTFTLTVIGDITASDINITGTLSAPVISNGNIEIDNNVIRTTDSNSDLELQANGAGVVRISDDFVVDGEMVLVNKKLIPKTHEGLKQWVIKKSQEEDYLIMTDVAEDVKDIISGGPVPRHIKPIWPFISFTAFNTLPPEFKKIYGIKESRIKNFILVFNLKLLKYTRPLLPPFLPY